jgi:hypothetical protein
MKKTIAVAALCLAGVGLAQADTGFSWGGDVRFRVTSLNEIPLSTGGVLPDYLFNRNRVRVWGQYDPNEDMTFRLRLVNEWRYYDHGKTDSNAWDPVEETLPDHLYAEFRNLWDGKLSLRVGRQDMIYGTGKVMLDGTPGDGSRTIFFDAVKASIKLEKNQVDLFVLYNHDIDDLTMDDKNRSLINISSTVEQNEAAAGFYVKNKSFDQVPLEYYYVHKKEYIDMGNADVDLNTAGFRVMPKFGNGLSGNLEVAHQWGDKGGNDIGGNMVDGSITFKPAFLPSIKPSFVAGYYHLSGDSSQGAGQDNNEWHQVFARWPQISELYVYSYIGATDSIGGWTNLSTAYLGMNMTPFAGSSLQLRYYDLKADENDGKGGGTGRNRGDLVTAMLKFKVTDNLTGHLRGEWLDPGNYHAAGIKDSTFARFNLEYKF